MKKKIPVLPLSRMVTRPYIVAVDFDDTLCFKGFPNIEEGEIIHSTITRMKYKLRTTPETEFILWTCREGEALIDAIEFVMKHKLPIKLYNEQHPYVLEHVPHSKDWRKIWADEYWDDKAVTMRV